MTYEFRGLSDTYDNMFLAVEANSKEEAIKIATKIVSDETKLKFKGLFEYPLVSLEEYIKT